MRSIAEKTVSLSEALSIVSIWRESNFRIVFTNGCFDILHTGHIDYLFKARLAGDKLILAVNSDDSVKRLKGPLRPINQLSDRMLTLAAFYFVDLVVSFSEDTPIKTIRAIKPDVLVKGGDYKKAEIVGAEFVEKLGGRVEIIPFLDGYSSTQIIQRIADRYGNNS